MKVLYIEDNEINRFVFEKLLAGSADVKVTCTGPEGLDAARQDSYDMIVIDLNLNDSNMDGFDVLKELQLMNYKEKNGTRFFALTSYAGKEWQEKCLDAGFDGYFCKPINPKILLENE